MTSVAERKDWLLARKEELGERMHEIEEELESHDSRDWEELAVEREEDEVLESLGNSSQAELRMIEAALGRIEAGEYGYCVKCGDEISQERLDVVPFTPFCKSCAR